MIFIYENHVCRRKIKPNRCFAAGPGRCETSICGRAVVQRRVIQDNYACLLICYHVLHIFIILHIHAFTHFAYVYILLYIYICLTHVTYAYILFIFSYFLQIFITFNIFFSNIQAILKRFYMLLFVRQHVSLIFLQC